MATYLQKVFKHKNHTKKYTVLVATSGDTGSAVSSAFANKPNFNVAILYPNNKISTIQELQLTTYDKNKTTYAVDSDFDTCQKFVKSAFTDTHLKSNINLLSANSINIARLLPQCLYYFYAYAKLKTEKQLTFVVPCGNCGNLVGGLIAQKLGLPVDFIAAQNDNNSLVKFINTGTYVPQDTICTISNAMDVGNPSNLKRIQYMFNSNINNLKQTIRPVSASQTETKNAIQYVYEKYNYIIDPHTAVAYAGYQKLNIKNHNNTYVFISTAHPAKFNETINEVLNIECIIPELEHLKTKPQHKTVINDDWIKFKTHLLSN